MGAGGRFEGLEKFTGRTALSGVREEGSEGFEDFLGGVDMVMEIFDARLAGLGALVLLCAVRVGVKFPSA